jgi:hypothetical protein
MIGSFAKSRVPHSCAHFAHRWGSQNAGCLFMAQSYRNRIGSFAQKREPHLGKPGLVAQCFSVGSAWPSPAAPQSGATALPKAGAKSEGRSDYECPASQKRPACPKILCQAPPKPSISFNHNKTNPLPSKINPAKPPFNYPRFATLKSATKSKTPAHTPGSFSLQMKTLRLTNNKHSTKSRLYEESKIGGPDLRPKD